jgi:hypothetical protein
MDQHPSDPAEDAQPPALPGHVHADRDDQATHLVVLDDLGEEITRELLRVGYAASLTTGAEQRLYPQVRELIRDTLDQLRRDLHDLDPQLTLTSVND